MQRILPVLATLLIISTQTQASGLLIPDEKAIPPLAMVNHRVTIQMEDQLAMTRVEQVFRNHTDRQLEATYVFPVPKGASVNKFSMTVNGKDVSGELLDAAKARQIYNDIVRRTQDPGLLEYVGNNVFRLKVFPILPKSDQKVTLSYSSVAAKDAGIVEYIYPLKTDGKATSTLQEFSIEAVIKSQQSIQNIYSPTHAISLDRTNDREIKVKFEKNQGLLDKDFQLFYSTSDKDIGFSTLTHRPISSEKGFFLMLISPRVEIPKDKIIPRDMVMVLDTSGSMRGPKMDQAKRAMKYCLNNLGSTDRFALMNFATTVSKYKDSLVNADAEQIEQGRKWVDNLEATGGTAINDALAAAIDMRSKDTSRTFTIIFFTDGQPTIGETNPDTILRNVSARNSASTRIFPFGVGDDVNAAFLDQLADQTRAVTTYVRPAEDIEAKVSSLYSKISNPVLANLKLSSGSDVHLEEVYPPQLPDLFHGGQLVVLGRYNGKGHTALKLGGTVGSESREFVFEINFADKTNDERGFVEHIWARRKVGYLLDQIRVNGEKKELVEETVAIAKKYGIATPYTSYLIVPDGPVPVAGRNLPTLGVPGGHPETMPQTAFGAGRFSGGGFGGGGVSGAGLRAGEPAKVVDFARAAQSKPGELAAKRDKAEDALGERLSEAEKDGKGQGVANSPRYLYLKQAAESKKSLDEARGALRRQDREGIQTGKLGVDLAIAACDLRSECKVKQSALQQVAGRNCLEFGGAWIDEAFDAKTPTVIVKAMSDAYFLLLERQPQLKEVFKLGNHLVWVTPCGTALVVDTNDGKEKLEVAEIDKLFVAKK